MSIIIPAPGNTPEQVRSNNAPYKASEKSKWLYELERAQWQASRWRSVVAQDNHVPPQPTLESRYTVTKPTATPHPEADTKFATSRVVTPLVPVVTSTNHAPALSIEINGVTPQAITIPNGMATMPEAAPKSAPDALGSMPGHPRTELRRFEKQHVHVYTKDGESQVWLRDATLVSQETQPLLTQLRERFRALGHHLLALNVNGQTILETPTHNRITAKD